MTWTFSPRPAPALGTTRVPERIDHECLARRIAEWDAREQSLEAADPRRPAGSAVRGRHRPASSSRLPPWRRAPLVEPECTALAGDVRRARAVPSSEAIEAIEARRRAEVGAVADQPEVRAAMAALVGRMTAPTGFKGWWRKLVGPRLDSVRALSATLVGAVSSEVDRRKRVGETTTFSDLRDTRDAVCTELVGRAFQALDPAARARWEARAGCRRSGCLVAAMDKQAKKFAGMPHDPHPDSLYSLQSTMHHLLRRIKGVGCRGAD